MTGGVSALNVIYVVIGLAGLMMLNVNGLH